MTDASAAASVVADVAPEMAFAASNDFDVGLEATSILSEHEPTNDIDDKRTNQDRSLMDNDMDDEEDEVAAKDSTFATLLSSTIEETSATNDALVTATSDPNVETQLAAPPSATSSVASLFQNSATHSMLHRRHSFAIAAAAAAATPTATSSLLITTQHTQQQPQQQQHRWDGFVRRGTRLKTLLEDAMTEVKTTVTAQKKRNRSNDDNNNNNDVEPDSQRRRVVQVADFTAELAREKTTEIFQLQRVSPEK